MKNKKTEDEYKEAAKNSLSVAGMCRYLKIKPHGGNYSTIHNKIKQYDIDISHFTGQGWNIGLIFKPHKKFNLKDILVEYSTYNSYKLKNRLLLEGYKDHICEQCKITEWCGKIAPLELHHINGKKTDNRIENLLILCPNCHALTDNYRGKKILKN